ncbi:hypothetical protein FQN54_000045 [Arachnomyces sp. PD_36]|nr:hypothetical protein FQN54_000045 [Arachnomyces sp. PD_36]
MSLTTEFKPAPSCLSDVYTTTSGILGWLGLGPPDPEECFPSGWEPTSQYFSPGICPSGYAVACSDSNGPETRATCCPSNYSCQTQDGSWPQYSTMICQALVADLPTSITAVTSGTTEVPIGLNAGGGINAFGLSIRWKEGDFPDTTTGAEATTTGGSTTSQEETGTAKEGSTSTAHTSQVIMTNITQPTSEPSSEGLSTGAKAGIGVGVAAVALIILGIIIFFLRRQRKSRSGVSGAEASSGGYQDVKTGAWVPGQHELYGHEPKRVVGNNGRGFVELSAGDHPPASELPGSTYR